MCGGGARSKICQTRVAKINSGPAGSLEQIADFLLVRRSIIPHPVESVPH